MSNNQTKNKIYLKDYQAPCFNVSEVELDIKLYDDHAVVDAELKMHKQEEGDLVLLGRDLELLSIAVNGQLLTSNNYQLDNEQLIVKSLAYGSPLPNDVTIKTSVKIKPQNNTSLEGLYMAGDGKNNGIEYQKNTMFVTQCEAEGFRKITFFPDRPDVLAKYITRVEADKKYPTLLANGHLIDSGELDGNRHYAVWQDPAKKPSYLFACVIADLEVIQDQFITAEGREVLLEIYTKQEDSDKCDVAMQALKDSMKWDEENYGRAYDLNRYMIVAVSQFNMGAMENKGLNIFNTACVLSTPETTTDPRTFSVKAIIAHEYFHNWTGNRITCRDWFQLCLKEGLTVFRDQSFSADHQSPAVQRIEDVSILRAAQFSEDAGALSHPVRPESFVEINNFYTATVYEKGAEICRMMANMMGKENYRKGTDEYFKRYDGKAVTVEDWLSALSSVDTRVSDFITWYRQPGTPKVSATSHFDENNRCLTLSLSQKTRHVAGYDAPKPLPIPVSTALFDANSGQIIAEKMLMLTKAHQDFIFEDLDVNTKPVVSLLRDFSAPVNLDFVQSAEELAFLIEHETNGFNRWQAAQILVNMVLNDDKDTNVYLNAIKNAVISLTKHPQSSDPMLAARLFDIPAEREMATSINKDYDPGIIKQKRAALKTKIAHHMQDSLIDLYHHLPMQSYEDTPYAKGVRALRNIILAMLVQTDKQQGMSLASQQYDQASCMTERIGALAAMIDYQTENVADYLTDFYNRFVSNELVIDMWFTAQAGSDAISLKQIQQLLTHNRFDWGTPNRVNAVMRGLAAQPVKLWSDEGLRTYLEVIVKLDKLNPALASRLLQPMARWNTLIQPLKEVAQTQLNQLKAQVTSKNVVETLDSILAISE